jgi:hypothetical protein
MNPVLREITASLMFVVMGVQSVAAQAPTWWAEQNVVIPGAVPDDYAAINQGQLKALASAAFRGMEDRLAGGAGSAVSSLVASWQQPTLGTDDFAVVTSGQLKKVAQPFYDRLNQVLDTTGYPWSVSTTPDDFSIVNLGQAKKMFAFPIPHTKANGAVGNAYASIWTGNRSGTNLGGLAEAPWTALTPLPAGTPKPYSHDPIIALGNWSTRNPNGYIWYEPQFRKDRKFARIYSEHYSETKGFSGYFNVELSAIPTAATSWIPQSNIYHYTGGQTPPMDQAQWINDWLYWNGMVLPGGMRSEVGNINTEFYALTAKSNHYRLRFEPGTALTFSLNGQSFSCPVAKDFRAYQPNGIQYGGHANYTRLVLPSQPVGMSQVSNALEGFAPSNTNSFDFYEEPTLVSSFSYGYEPGT